MINIEFGKEYKYKELCHQFGEYPERGSKLNTQLTRFRNNYDIEKTVSNTYLIKKQYSDIEIIEHQKYHKEKSYIETILYTLLTNIQSNVVRTDMKGLLQVLSIVNKDFHFAKWHSELVEDNLFSENDDKGDLPLFVDEVEKISKRVVKEVLNDMQSRALISIEYIPMFAKQITIDNNKFYTVTEEASDKVGKPAFLEARRVAMKYFGFEHWEDMMTLTYFQWKEAKNIMTRYLHKELGIQYFYYEYKIILNKVGLQEIITNNFEPMKHSFNKYMQEKLMNSNTMGFRQMVEGHKEKYIDALVNTENDLNLRRLRAHESE